MKRILLATVLTFLMVFGLFSCGVKDEVIEKPSQVETEAEKEEEIVEEIYAKTPEEASDKCMSAIYTGDFQGAKRYVVQGGDAFSSVAKFRDRILGSINSMSQGVSKEKRDNLIKNTFNNVTFKRISTEKNGETASVHYTISMPDMGAINFSSYMDEYIAHLGMSMEEFMKFLESMNEEESKKWSSEFGTDIFNYVLERESDFPKVQSQITVSVKNSKNGWIVEKISSF